VEPVDAVEILRPLAETVAGAWTDECVHRFAVVPFQQAGQDEAPEEPGTAGHEIAHGEGSWHDVTCTATCR
jgi:hypothetical protein